MKSSKVTGQLGWTNTFLSGILMGTKDLFIERQTNQEQIENQGLILLNMKSRRFLLFISFSTVKPEAL